MTRETVPPSPPHPGLRWQLTEVLALLVLFFFYAGDPPPMVNEAHYLAKAKHFWDPSWCARDLFVASGKAHTTFYAVFGWPTLYVSLPATAWGGRAIGWLMLAFGLQRLSWQLLPRRLASLAVALVWIAGLEYGNLAGEWVVGGIEAKIPAYGLTLWALAELVQRRWGRVWLLLGAASAFHVLVGGWSVVAALVTWLATERGRDDRPALLTPALVAGGLLSLFGLIPALWLTLGATAEESLVATKTYTYFRIAHHLLPAALQPWWYLRHGLLVLAAIVLSGWYRRVAPAESWRRINTFVMATVGLAAVGLLIGLLPAFAPNLAAKLLRYYWFRLTDFAVPLLLGLYAVRLLAEPQPKWLRIVGLSVIMASAVGVARSSLVRMRLGVPPAVSNRMLGWDSNVSPETQQQVYRDWRAVCDWVRNTTAPDELFLTPRHQQTFKWYAQRAEVVNWKDVPQDAPSINEWSRRFSEIFPRRLGTIRVTIQHRLLRDYAREYGVRYLIVDRRISGQHLPLVQIYPRGFEQNETYAIYELPR